MNSHAHAHADADADADASTGAGAGAGAGTGAGAGASPPVAPGAGEPKPAEPAERRFTLEEALQAAQNLHRAGRLDAAAQIYRAVLEQLPDQPDALHFLGILEHQRGDSEAGIALVRRAIEALPGEPGPWNNLGNILVEAGRLDAAADAYRRCLEIDSRFADTHNNLGTLQRLRGEAAEAEASYRRAIEARPGFADAWNNLGRLLVGQHRIREAVACACKAITLLPHDPQARKLLGLAHYMLGEIEQAAAVYRDWLAAEPGNPIALHHLAACSGEAVPARASDAYVASTFDAFADSFDAKLELLGYRAPQLVADALHAARGEPARSSLDVLDAGCGTGLCGPLLREHARELTGIDLSPRMLERARRRGVYDRLEAAELGAWLAAGRGCYDVVVSADTLCYFGDLAPVMQAAHGALRAGGTLVFTVEALPEAAEREADADARGAGSEEEKAETKAPGCSIREAGYVLQAHGRYAHARAYVEACLEAAGLKPVSIGRETLRREGGAPVVGWLVSATKPG